MNELLLPVVASGGGDIVDQYFRNVTLLLRGEGANGAQNNTFVDNSPLNLTLTRAGDSTQGTFTPFSKEPSKWGVYFDGTGDNLTIPYNVNLVPGSGDFTVELWFYTTNGTTRQDIYSMYTASDGYGIALSYAVAGDILFYNGNTLLLQTTGSKWSANQWNHLAVVRNGTSLKIYINGTEVGTTTNSTNLTGSSALYIGMAGNATLPYTGYISNVRFLKGTALYTSAFTAPSSPLTAITNTQLLTCQSNRFIDNSTNNFTLTPAGDAAITTVSPFQNSLPLNFAAGAYSVSFDGAADYLSISDNANLRLGSGDFTVEFWINYRALASYQTIFDKGYVSAGGIVLQTALNAGNCIVSISGSAVITANTASPVNTWDHYALVRNGSTLTLYRNGLNVGSATNSVDINNTGTLFIGGSSGGGGYYVNGYISNFRIVKGTAVYTSNFTVPTSKLTAITNTQLLTCQDELLKDYSTNNWAITGTGQVELSSYDPIANSYAVDANTGSSVYLDGTGDYVSISNDSSLDINASFTIDAWVYTTATTDQVFLGRGGGNAVVGQQWNSTDGAYYLLAHSGGLAYWQWNINNAGSPASLSGTIRRNAWNHLAVGFNGTTTRFWINGVSAGTSTTAYTIPTNRTLTSVGRQLSNEAFANGFISDVRLVKGTDVYGVGNANITVPTAPLTAIANTKLLVKGGNAGIIDSSRSSNIITVGNAQIRTNIKKFNSSSMFFDGTGDYCTTINMGHPNSMGTGDFTLEAWIKSTTGGTYNGPFNQYPSGTTNGKWDIKTRYNSTNNFVFTYNNGSTNVDLQASPSINLNDDVWHHIAVVRSGTNIYLFSDGVQRLSTTISATQIIGLSSVRVNIGYNPTDNTYYTGYIDELRITRGVARYTANFTAPTLPFPGA